MTEEQFKIFIQNQINSSPIGWSDVGKEEVMKIGLTCYRAGLAAVRDKYKEIRLDGYPTHYGILCRLQDWLDAELTGRDDDRAHD